MTLVKLKVNAALAKVSRGLSAANHDRGGQDSSSISQHRWALWTVAFLPNAPPSRMPNVSLPTALTRSSLSPHPSPRLEIVLPFSPRWAPFSRLSPSSLQGLSSFPVSLNTTQADGWQVDPRSQQLPKLQLGMCMASWTSPLRHCINIPDGNPK